MKDVLRKNDARYPKYIIPNTPNTPMTTSLLNKIPIKYSTNNYTISFCLDFALGIDSAIEPDAEIRTDVHTFYDIEKIQKGEQVGYRVVGHEGPLVTRVSNISISNIYTNDTHTYALGVVVDIKKPEYATPASIQPINIERDGVMWNIPLDNQPYSFDQNAKANFQVVLRRALEEGYVPNEEERFLGMEETSETTGLLYITFMVFQKEKQLPTSVTRSGGNTLARVGYGNMANTASNKSTYQYAPNTEKYILPIRYRISKDSAVSSINCADNLKSAMDVSELQGMTMEPPM